jgi:uncharacterized protein (TIGR02001 family)
MARPIDHSISTAKEPTMASRSTLPATLAALAVAAVASSAALAQAPAAAAPEPDLTLSANVGLFSNYVFRGITQTNEKPAVQGGFDLAHKSGFYLGTWASNVSWISDLTPGVSASMEWDFYGGYKGSLPADFGYDLGVLYYWYPGNYSQAPEGYVKPDTTELYAALSWKFLSLKYSYSVNNKTFGVGDSRGSSYLDLTASYDILEKVNEAINKVTIFGHLGHQWFTGSPNGFDNGNYDYGDWKVGASADIYGVVLGIYGTGTNAQDQYWTNVYGKNTSGGQFVAYVQKTF